MIGSANWVTLDKSGNSVDPDQVARNLQCFQKYKSTIRRQLLGYFLVAWLICWKTSCCSVGVSE